MASLVVTLEDSVVNAVKYGVMYIPTIDIDLGNPLSTSDAVTINCKNSTFYGSFCGNNSVLNPNELFSLHAESNEYNGSLDYSNNGNVIIGTLKYENNIKNIGVGSGINIPLIIHNIYDDTYFFAPPVTITNNYVVQKNDDTGILGYGVGDFSISIFLANIWTNIFNFSNVLKSLIIVDPTDPYYDGGESGTGGGTGSFDGTGDDIDIPSLPTLSAADTGFITLFNPTITQLKNLANYMWSNGFDLETFKKLFADPMDCILGLSIVPVAIPNGETSTVSVGNISTDVSMTKAVSQYVTVDCGTLNVNEYWGAYLDYDPYTKAEIYLPYIGTHALSVDDIMGKSVHVVYHVDILSGACAAYVKCGGSVLYTFIGQCSSSIPISGNDWTNVINGVLSIAGAVGSMVATGGASAPMAAGTIASTAVNGLKPNVEKSGSMSGTGGMLGVQTPYLILTRPRQALPARQNTFTGYPSFITSKLGSLSGYTEIEEIHLENIPGTEQEISEIESLLKGGVIL